MTDREKIIIAIEKAKKQSEEYAQDKIIVPFREADMILALLKEQEPKTGHWFISEYEYLTCSCCGESYYTGADSTEGARQRLADGQYYKFCPYCGAKMTDGR